jgi:hypothetical protein
MMIRRLAVPIGSKRVQFIGERKKHRPQPQTITHQYQRCSKTINETPFVLRPRRLVLFN